MPEFHFPVVRVTLELEDVHVMAETLEDAQQSAVSAAANLGSVVEWEPLEPGA